MRIGCTLLICLICNFLLAAEGENYFYKFDYHASILKIYQPQIQELEAKYAYRQKIAELADRTEDLWRLIRRDPSTEGIRQVFESMLKTLAFVDGNYAFQFNWTGNVGAPYNSLTYIQELQKLAIPKHIICEIQLYRIAYYVNTYRPELAYEKDSTGYFLTYQYIKRFMDIYTSYAVELSPKYPYLMDRLYEFQLYFKNYSIMNEVEVSNKIHRYYQFTEDQTFKKVYKEWKESQDPVMREHLLYAAATQSPIQDFPEETGAVYGNGYMVPYVPPTVRQVQDSLKNNQASVEVITYTKYTVDSLKTIPDLFFYEQKDKTKWYAALVLDKKQVNFISLSPAVELEAKQYKYYYNSIKFQKTDTVSYVYYWEKVDSVLTSHQIKNIYFCPDGVYNLINLNTLKTSQGDYVLNHYDITNVINTRTLLSNEIRSNIKNQSYLIGFPNYNLGLEKKKKSKKKVNTSVFQRSVEREYSSGMVTMLPGTREELYGIKESFNESKVSYKILYLNDASEQNVYELDNPYILHIASHGFFFSDLRDSVFKDPLLRSGVFLSGCNASILKQHYPNPDSLDNDGVLYAKEVTKLPLYQTKLVVLSACETGLGEIHEGDGVVGFQRAFGIAGVEYMMMSLWKVDDQATKEFMVEFYKQIFENKKSIEEAYTLAVESIKINYSSPYYWGAFKLIKN